MSDEKDCQHALTFLGQYRFDPLVRVGHTRFAPSDSKSVHKLG
jgi:hypothetical protein